MVTNTKDGKPRGYAFVEYEHEKDMHCKYPVSRHTATGLQSFQ